MDRIKLPLVSDNMPVARVFDRMARVGVHAAVVAVPGREPMLVTNREVDDALELGLERVNDINGRPLRVFEAEMDDWESALDEARVSYGTIATGGLEAGGDGASDREVGEVVMVTIITRHEGLAYDIRNTGEVCRCEKNMHRAPKGGPCPVCSSRVRCA